MDKLEEAYNKYVLNAGKAKVNEIEEKKTEIAMEEDICLIDYDNQTISIPEKFKIAGVTADNNVKRIYFKCLKKAQVVDFSEMEIYINYMNANQEPDRYHCEEKEVEGDYVIFSWKVSNFATKYKGKVNFIVCMENENGEHWNTTLAEVEVLEGLETKPNEIEEPVKDVIRQLLEAVERKCEEAKTEIDNKVEAFEVDAEKIKKQVTEEGEKQVAEVQRVAQEIIDDREQIQANKKAVETLTQSKANAIINTAKGDKIAVFDSSDLQLDNLKLFGKSKQIQTTGAQLFDASKLSSESGSNAIITNNGDGSFTISGGDSMTGGIASSYDYTTEESRKILKAGPFKLSCEKSRPFFSATIVTSKGSVVVLDNHTKPIGEITQEMIEDEEFHLNYGIYAVKGNSIIPATIKPMLYQDGDGTWEPYTDGKPAPNPDYPIDITNVGDDGKVDSVTHGEQLFESSKLPSVEKYGASLINNGDGSFTMKGSGKLTSYFSTHIALSTEKTKKMLKPGSIKISGEDTYPRFAIYLYYDNDKYYFLCSTKTKVGEITEEMLIHEDAHLRFYFYGDAENSIISGTTKPMVYQDGDGIWEPFKQFQQLSIQTPNGLLGLPVESNGNYTDNKEKQWACDEIDLKRGKKKSYVKRITLNGTESWVLQSINEHGIANFSIPLSGENKPSNKNLLSTHFIKQDTTIAETTEEGILINYGAPMYFRVKQERASTVEGFKSWLSENPVTIVYDLETPIETDLTPEEIADYKQLHTNYPSTVIQNDEGAGMEISYVADTKLYTDNKIKDAVSKQMQNIADLLYLMPEEIQAKMIETDTNRILESEV